MRKVEITSLYFENETLYGIVISDNESEVRYCNLTQSREKIEQLKRNLEDSDISAVHIPDIIKDAIAEEACNRLIENALL